MKLHDLSATALLEGYASKQFTPLDVMRDVIARVGAFEPHIRATYLFAPERALAEAEASTARWAKGEPSGALDGVPVTIKENIATQGDPKPLGTAATDLTPSAEDAPPAARLREAGAIIFSKTTMPDYGMLSSGLSSFHPLARNPWNLDRKAPAARRRGQARRRRRALWSVAPWHRHRRLGAPAGRLVRAFSASSRAPRTGPHRPALHRPCRRPD